MTATGLLICLQALVFFVGSAPLWKSGTRRHAIIGMTIASVDALIGSALISMGQA